MRRCSCWLLVLFAASLAGAWAQSSGPHIGYLYPAGGKQGTTFRMVIGGQLLAGTDDAYVSGRGVHVSVSEYVRPLNQNELSDIWQVLRNLVRSRWSLRTMQATAAQGEDAPTIPNHPWLRDLDHKSNAEIARLRAGLFDPRKQMNAQIAEQVEVRVTIDADAAPGDRELRLAAPGGLTNPLCFQVGTLPETREEDLDRPGASAPVVALPALLNGQIQPGEVDHFLLRAVKGQQLVIRMQARQLIPYLADAVPGWFQAVMALRDPQGNEVAYDDDYRFDPDPVLFYKVPQDGVYQLAVRDSLYRGRDDFVYRIAAGELPFVTSLFPLGGRAGLATTAAVSGWNLPADKLALDTRPEDDSLRRARLTDSRGLYAEATYAVDTLPEGLEAEPNDTVDTPQPLTLPVIVNGRIARPGDLDVFSFEGQAGIELVVEVYARRLNSPLDSAVQLLDPTGKIIASNDDNDDLANGLSTHQADSYLRVKLPQDGTYRVCLSDTQRQGGAAYAYRLRLSAARPDFALRVTPSTVNLRPGGSAKLTVTAVRRDGFAGEVELTLKDAPAGFTLNGGKLPSDKNTVEMTISAPRDARPQVLPIRVEGQAQIAGERVTRPAVPAENLMQAFAYWHLVPQQELVLALPRARRVPAVWRPLVPGVQLTSAMTVELPLGTPVQVPLKTPAVLPDEARTPLASLMFTAANSPPGITLVGTSITPTGVLLTLQADAYIAQAGDAGNLIVEAATKAEGRRPIPLGVLPPISFKVVRP